MLPDERLRQILMSKMHEHALAAMKKHGHQSECWSIVDGVLVIYDENDPPSWLAKPLEAMDEDGHTPEFLAAQAMAAQAT